VQSRRRIAVETTRPARLFWALAAPIVIADQITKALVRAALSPAESIELIRDALYLTHVRNTGAAFGLMPGGRTLFILTSLIVLVGIAGYWRRQHPRARWLVTALALAASGAAGNLIDRAYVGRVTDFVDFSLINFPVFNVADCAIVIGVGMLIVWVMFGPEPGDDAAAPAGTDVGEPDAS
jgi:signal peptidase II